MKTLFLFALLLPLTALSQIGIKGGFTTPKGYHAGLIFTKELTKGSNGYFQLEALYNRRQDRDYYTITNERGDSIGLGYTTMQNSYFMLPVTFRSEFNFKPVMPFFQIGVAPQFGFSAKSTSLDLGALFGLGIRINRVSVDGRFVFNTKGLKTETHNKNFMISLSYFLTKPDKD